MQKNYYAIIPANVRYDEDLSDKAKLLYGEITALTNSEGYCWATNAYFADLYKCHETTISRLISQLEKKAYIHTEVNKNGYKTVRNIYINAKLDLSKNAKTEHSKIAKSDLSKNDKSEHSKNAIQNITLLNNTSNTKLDNKKTNKKENSAEFEREFESLWKLYPRKLGKAAALKFYIKARKVKKTPYETIEKGLYRYINYLEEQGTDEQYIMHGSTWFNQEKWLDEYICVGLNKKPKTAFEYYQQQYGGEIYEPRRNSEIIDYDTEFV